MINSAVAASTLLPEVPKPKKPRRIDAPSGAYYNWEKDTEPTREDWERLRVYDLKHGKEVFESQNQKPDYKKALDNIQGTASKMLGVVGGSKGTGYKAPDSATSKMAGQGIDSLLQGLAQLPGQILSQKQKEIHAQSQPLADIQQRILPTGIIKPEAYESLKKMGFGAKVFGATLRNLDPTTMPSFINAVTAHGGGSQAVGQVKGIFQKIAEGGADAEDSAAELIGIFNALGIGALEAKPLISSLLGGKKPVPNINAVGKMGQIAKEPINVAPHNLLKEVRTKRVETVEQGRKAQVETLRSKKTTPEPTGVPGTVQPPKATPPKTTPKVEASGTATKAAIDGLPGVRNLPDKIKAEAMSRAEKSGIEKQGAMTRGEYAGMLQDMGIDSAQAAKLAHKKTLSPQEVNYLGHLYDATDKAAKEAGKVLKNLQDGGASQELIAQAQRKFDELDQQATDVLMGFTHGSSDMGRGLRMLQELEGGVLDLSKIVRRIERGGAGPKDIAKVKSAYEKYQEAVAAAQRSPSVTVTQEIQTKLQIRADAAMERFKSKRSVASSGIDPTMMYDLADWGASKLAIKAIDIGEFTKHLIAEIEPHLGLRFTRAQAAEIYNRSWKRLKQEAFAGSEYGPDILKETGPFGVRGGKSTVAIKDPAVIKARKELLDEIKRFERDDVFTAAANVVRAGRLGNPFSRLQDIGTHIVRGAEESLVGGNLAAASDIVLFPRHFMRGDRAARQVNYIDLFKGIRQSLKESPERMKQYMNKGEDADFLGGEDFNLGKLDAKRESNTGVKPLDAYVKFVHRMTGLGDLSADEGVYLYTRMEGSRLAAEMMAAGKKFEGTASKKEFVRQTTEDLLQGIGDDVVLGDIEMAAKNASIEFRFAEDNPVSGGIFSKMVLDKSRGTKGAARLADQAVFAFPRIFWNFAKLNLRMAGGAGEAAVRAGIKTYNREVFTVADRRLISKLVAQNTMGVAAAYSGGIMAERGLFDGTRIDKAKGEIHWPVWVRWSLQNFPGMSSMVLVGAGQKLLSEAHSKGDLDDKQYKRAMFRLGTGLVTNQPTYTGIRELKDLGENPDKWEKLLAGTVTKAIPLSGGLNAYGRYADEFTEEEPSYRNTTGEGTLDTMWLTFKAHAPWWRKDLERKKLKTKPLPRVKSN